MERAFKVKEYEVQRKEESGSEHHCFKVTENGNGEEKVTETEKLALKFQHWFGKIWQTPGEKNIKTSLRMIDEQGVRRIAVTILEHITLMHPNGKKEEIPLAYISPFIDNIKELRVRYKDFLDPETGPQTIKEFAKIVKAADEIYHDPQNPRGLDPYGGEIVTDVLKGLIPALALRLADKMPEGIRRAIRSRINGMKGQLRNFIKTKEGPMLIDPGTHDFSENGKFQSVTKTIHHLMFASLIELLKYATQKHREAGVPEKQLIPNEELEALPFNGTEAHKKIIQQLMTLMFPLFDKHIEQEKQQHTSRPTGSAKSCPYHNYFPQRRRHG